MLKALPIEKTQAPVITPIGETGWYNVLLGTLPPESVRAVESLNNNRRFSYDMSREGIYGYAMAQTETPEYSHMDRLAIALRAMRVVDGKLSIDVKPVGAKAGAVRKCFEGGTAFFEIAVESRSKTDVSSATSAVVVIHSDELVAEFG